MCVCVCLSQQPRAQLRDDATRHATSDTYYASRVERLAQHFRTICVQPFHFVGLACVCVMHPLPKLRRVSRASFHQRSKEKDIMVFSV